MSAPDLLQARLARVELARPSWHYLREVGVDFRFTETATGGAYFAPVKAIPALSFAIEEGADDALVIEVLDEDCECVDLLCWRPHAPERWRTMFGAVPALGMGHAVEPATYWRDLPLQLFRTPLEWLQAFCDGATILDMNRGARWLLWLAEMGLASTIAPWDDLHAAEIAAARRAIVDRQRLVVPVAGMPPARRAA